MHELFILISSNDDRYTTITNFFKLNTYYTSTTLTSYGNVDIASVRYGYLFGCLSFLFRIFFEGTEFLLNMMTIISSTLTRFRAVSNTSPKVLSMG